MISEILAVTNRRLCTDDFENRICLLCQSGISGIILREKDLPSQNYMSLGRRLLEICRTFSVPIIINTDINCARALSVSSVQLPFNKFIKTNTSDFKQIIVSVHSQYEAFAAQTHGANALIAGHIFPTECKKNIPPRGLDFLKSICSSVDIPVYAIGGISPDNAPDIISAGASGICVMSGFMTCSAPQKTLQKYINSLT